MSERAIRYMSKEISGYDVEVPKYDVQRKLILGIILFWVLQYIEVIYGMIDLKSIGLGENHS